MHANLMMCYGDVRGMLLVRDTIIYIFVLCHGEVFESHLNLFDLPDSGNMTLHVGIVEYAIGRARLGL